MFLDGRFRRLVVFGQRAVGRGRAEEQAGAVRGHDEGLHAALGHRRLCTVRHVAHPLAVLPFDDGAAGVPRAAVQVDGGTVVQDAAVLRPAPRPVGEEANLRLHGRLRRIAALGLAAFFLGPASGVEPVEGRGGAVGLQRGEHGDLLALPVLLAVDFAVGLELAVDALRNVRRVEFFVPAHLEELFGAGPAFFLVHLAHEVDERNPEIAEVAGLAFGFHGLVEPLQPAAAVADGPFLLDAVRRRQEEDFCLDLGRVGPGAAPVVGGFGVVYLGDDQPVEIIQGLAHLMGVGEAVHGVHAHDEAAAHLALEDAVHDEHIGVVFAVGQLGQEAVAEVVLGGGAVAVPGLEQAGHVLRAVLPPVHTALHMGDGRIGLVVVGQSLPRGHGGLVVAGDAVVEQGMVGGTLHVRFAAQGVDAAAGYADVAEQELDDGGGTDVLHAHGMLRPAKGVEHGTGLVGLARGAEDVVHAHEVGLGNAGGGGNAVQRVALEVLSDHVEHAARVLERIVPQGSAGRVALEAPARLVVAAGLGVIAGEETVGEAEALADDEGSVGVVHHVFLEPAVGLEDVAYHAAEEGDVRAGTERHMEIAAGGRARELRVHVHKRGPAFLGLHDPLESDGVMFCSIAAHDEDSIGILDVYPVVRHGSAAV